MTWTAVPNFRALGPRLGPKVNEVKKALAAADGNEVHRQLDARGYVEVVGERLTADDVELRAESHEAFALAEDNGWAVALDLELTPELRAEGPARELVRVINDRRKEEGFQIADRIDVKIALPDELWSATEPHHASIGDETLALTFERTERGEHELELDGTPIGLTLLKR
jgi:isoleucyl-tRNA synthetase